LTGNLSKLAGLVRKTRLSAVALLVLVVFGLAPLNFLSETWGQTRSPSLVRKVFSCPGGFVATPEGCVPKECTFGPTHQFDSTTGDLTFDNGTHIVVPDHCLKGTPVISITSVYSDGSQTSQTVSGSKIAPFPTNNWVEDAHYSNCFLGICAGLGGETGNWPVPTAPNNADGQTIFLFIGLQPYCTFGCFIIQPVLTWGNGCYNWSGWSIASYYVSGSTCTYSAPQGVSAGHLISGAMWINGNCGHTCNIWEIKTTDQTSGVSTQLQQNQISVVDAFVTLEVYNVVRCGDYPASGQTQFSSLTVGPGAVSWGAQLLQNDGCGEGVNINNNAATVNLLY